MIATTRPIADAIDLQTELVASIHLSPLATIVTDARAPDNPIIAANAAFLALTGYAAEDLIGRNCRLLSGQDTESEGRTRLREAIRACQPILVELTNYRKDGSRFRNAVMLAPVYDEENALAFFVGTQMAVSMADASHAAAERLADLTPQQLRVLRLMAQGLRHNQIADEMNLSVKTIKMHRGALVKRLGVATSTEAVRLAIEAGL